MILYADPCGLLEIIRKEKFSTRLQVRPANISQYHTGMLDDFSFTDFWGHHIDTRDKGML